MAKETVADSNLDSGPGALADSPPNLTQYINIANYTYTSGLTPFSAKLEKEIGLKPLVCNGKVVKELDPLTGFYGEAFVTTGTADKQVIVGFEGTNIGSINDPRGEYDPPSHVFEVAQAAADVDIYTGQNAPCYTTALDFTEKAIKDAASKGISQSDVTLDGHSLGAAQAEYVATQTGLAGTTFGTPGIPVSDFNPNVPSQLTNYVERGDPVGNYSADSPRALGSIVLDGDNIQHFGGQIYKGSYLGRLELQFAATAYKTNTDTGYAAAAATLAYAAEQYHLLGTYAKDLSVPLYDPDGTGGADTDFFSAIAPLGASSPVCFASGALIRVARDDGALDVAVEDLVVGDIVVTASGVRRPIRWLGHRRIDCRCHSNPRSAWPVRIEAHTFGLNRPARDLLVSPGHAICVDVAGETLIPASALVNGATIVQVEMDRVTYWHVELDRHDILLAENLPTESYLEMGNRGFFVEARATSLRARPDTPIVTHADFCRPYVAGGPVVAAVRAWLAARTTGREGGQRGGHGDRSTGIASRGCRVAS